MLRTRGSAEASSSAPQITSDRSAPQVFHRSICCEGFSEVQSPRQKPFLPKSLESLAVILLPWCDPALRPNGLRHGCFPQRYAEQSRCVLGTRCNDEDGESRVKEPEVPGFTDASDRQDIMLFYYDANLSAIFCQEILDELIILQDHQVPLHQNYSHQHLQG